MIRYVSELLLIGCILGVIVILYSLDTVVVVSELIVDLILSCLLNFDSIILLIEYLFILLFV